VREGEGHRHRPPLLPSFARGRLGLGDHLRVEPGRCSERRDAAQQSTAASAHAARALADAQERWIHRPRHRWRAAGRAACCAPARWRGPGAPPRARASAGAPTPCRAADGARTRRAPAP
jgi:hypothetical protein